MITPTLTRKYREARAAGWKPEQAFRDAKVRLRFAAGERAGLVRLRTEWDEAFSFSDLIPDDMPEGAKQAEMQRIDRLGVVGIIGEICLYPPTAIDGDCCRRSRDGEGCEHWEAVDSCWGFIGDDWKNSGYDTDIMDATIRAAVALIRRSSPYLAI